MDELVEVGSDREVRVRGRGGRRGDERKGD